MVFYYTTKISKSWYNDKVDFIQILSEVKVLISKDMSITDIVENYPETIEVFIQNGMHCFGCMAARFENVEQGALAHGIDVDKLIEDLNKTVNK